MEWLFLVANLFYFHGILGNPDSKRLYDDLLSNYNRLIRPVGNNSDRLTVKMGLKLSQLIDVVRDHSNLLSNQIKTSTSLVMESEKIIIIINKKPKFF